MSAIKGGSFLVNGLMDHFKKWEAVKTTAEVSNKDCYKKYKGIWNSSCKRKPEPIKYPEKKA